jgi:tetratricopeptide (TPR) repeat protein
MARAILIGLAGLDWASFEALTHSGGLPALSALRRRGCGGWLTGAPLTRGPAPWASLVTGLQPEAHGVWREQEEWPGGIRPTGKASWRVAPLWARLEAAGVATGGVAWPAIRPGAAWPGLHIDDSFRESTAKTPADWALPRQCLPAQFRDTLRDRRVHISQITGDMIAPLLPGLRRGTTEGDDAPARIAMGLAQAATVQAGAAFLLSETSIPALFIHHAWLGQIRRAFADASYLRFADILSAAWRLLDQMVGRLLSLAGPESLVLLVSPGWRTGPGVVVAAGPGVTPDANFRGAGLLDIAPTVLAHFGLRDDALPGRPLQPMAALESLGPAPTPAIAPHPKPDPVLVYGLRKHGYRPPPRPAAAWRAQGVADLASMMLERDPAGAGAMARAALVLDPGNIRALRVRVRSHVALEEAEPLPALGETLMKAAPERGWGALAQGAYHVLKGEKALAAPWLVKAEAEADIGTLVTVATVWLAASRPGAAERVFKAILAKDPLNATAEIGLAMSAIARRDFLNAEQGLLRAMKLDPGRPAIYLQLAQAYARTARTGEAARAAEMALNLGAPPVIAAAARAGRLRAA